MIPLSLPQEDRRIVLRSFWFLISLSGSMWVDRSAGANHTGHAPFASVADASSMPNGWIRNYLRWAFQSENIWAICLIPFLCFLRMVSAEEQTSSGSNIYTLF